MDQEVAHKSLFASMLTLQAEVDMPSEYDRIFKDILEQFLPELLHRYADRKIEIVEESNVELTGTYEWRVDYLLKVRDEEDRLKMLHIEFQANYSPDLIYRVATYNILLQLKHKLPVESFVIFLGQTPEKMQVDLPPERIFRGYQAIELRRIPLDFFKESGSAATNVLGILSNIKPHQKNQAVRDLIERIRNNSESLADSNQNLQRMFRLSRINDLKEIVFENLKDMPIVFHMDKEQQVSDPLYKIGLEQGRLEGQLKNLQTMVQKGFITIEKASEMMKISVEKLLSKFEEFKVTH